MNPVKMNPPSSELPFHVHNWLIISLKDFCIVIRKWLTFWPSKSDSDLEDYKKNTPQSQMFLEIFVSVACNNVTKL